MRFNSRYLGQPPWDNGISPPELIEFIEETKPGRALDLGCGTGTNLLRLAQAGWQVEGVEFALIAYLKARRKLKKFGKQARVHLGSVIELDFLTKPYDLILDIGCYHTLNLEGKEKYRKQITRLLVQGGTYLLYTFVKTAESGRGIEESEIEKFLQKLKLVERRNGLDHGSRTSTWLRFEK